MRLFIYFSLVGFALSRHVKDLPRRTKDDEPFSAQNDLFSQALSLSAPDDVAEEEENGAELTVTTNERFTGQISKGLVTALPPGYSPQPPGFETEEERLMAKSRPLMPSDTHKEDGFHMSSESEEESEEKEKEKNRELRKFQPEISSVPVSLSLKPPITYDPDSSPFDSTSVAFEGSGAFFEEDNSTTFVDFSNITTTAPELNLAEIVATNNLFEGKQDVETTEAPVSKVSGEAGEERGCAGEEKTNDEDRGRKKNTVDVGTFLVAGEGTQPVDLAVEEDAYNTTGEARADFGGPPVCAPVELCAKNCFVSLNERGCQVCECLWQALTCERDSDCPETSQHCDLGKCDCSDGYVQDMRRSGMCKMTELPGENLSLESLGVEKTEAATEEPKKTEMMTDIQKNIASYFGKRLRRSTEDLGEKPRRAERLQWPGEA